MRRDKFLELLFILYEMVFMMDFMFGFYLRRIYFTKYYRYLGKKCNNIKIGSLCSRYYSSKTLPSVLQENKIVESLPINSFTKLENVKNNIEGEIEFIKTFEEIECILSTLKKINEKGYINDMDLLNYPLINECIRNYLFIYEKDKDKDKDKKDKKPKIGFETYLGEEIINLKDAKELYKWSYNLIMLNLYKITEEVVFKLNQVNQVNQVNQGEEFINDNLLIDYITLAKDILHKIDPSIRSKLTKRGISITQNIYTGFDTEYVNVDSLTNKLLSIQLSINTKTMVQFPLNNEFDFKEIDVLTGKELNSMNSKSNCINWSKIKEFINKSITYIRELKLGNYDDSFQILINGLKNYKNEKGEFLKYITKDNVIIFIFERSPIKQYFKECNSYKFVDLVRTSYQLVEKTLENDLINIRLLLERITKSQEIKIESEKIDFELDEIKTNIEKMTMNLEELDDNQLNERIFLKDNKKYTRTNNTSYTKERVSVTKKINNYLIAHYTPSDLSMLSDFEEFKSQMDIVNKCFVTLKKPILIDGINVIIRDTMLIAPGGKKSLDAISSLYSGINKIKISSKQIKNMELFKRENPELFKKYALQDSLIALVHGNFMEEFNHTINGLGVPLTLSSLSGNFIRKYWKDKNYKGYQVSENYLMTNVSKTLTPVGLSVVKDVGIKSTMYIANYKGGRNESFMYGYENEKYWYDVDLVSAYTTAMLLLGTPDYEKAKVLTAQSFKGLKWTEMINSYTILLVDFEFPESVKYPSIPCNIDETTTAYPLKGSSAITSLDYLVALKQGVKFNIKEVYYTPFKTIKDSKGSYIIEKPFYDCIKEIQELRSKYPKGTINNALWKEIGNSLYGLVVRGINEKMKFDARTSEMKRMEGNNLSNPLLASWITSFIRGVIGELLHGVQILGGTAVSVTTDGFITDIKDLENKILKNALFKKSLFAEYRKVRNNTDIIETKNEGLGIMSWSTRGQLSVNANILAATGFQRGNLSLQEIHNLFLETLLKDKELFFIQKQLRSGKDIFKKGGHVTDILSDKIYRLLYDNKRFIIEEKGKTLLDSRPLNTIDEGSLLRYISKLPKVSLYSINISNPNSGKYKNKQDLMVRNFIRALLNNMFNLNSDYFKNYAEIIEYLKEFDKSISISENSISQLKRRGFFTKVPRNAESELFVDYIKIKFPNFEEKEWFK